MRRSSLLRATAASPGRLPARFVFPRSPDCRLANRFDDLDRLPASLPAHVFSPARRFASAPFYAAEPRPAPIRVPSLPHEAGAGSFPIGRSRGEFPLRLGVVFRPPNPASLPPNPSAPASSAPSLSAIAAEHFPAASAVAMGLTVIQRTLPLRRVGSHLAGMDFVPAEPPSVPARLAFSPQQLAQRPPRQPLPPAPLRLSFPHSGPAEPVRSFVSLRLASALLELPFQPPLGLLSRPPSAPRPPAFFPPPTARSLAPVFPLPQRAGPHLPPTILDPPAARIPKAFRWLDSPLPSPAATLRLGPKYPAARIPKHRARRRFPFAPESPADDVLGVSDP